MHHKYGTKFKTSLVANMLVIGLASSLGFFGCTKSSKQEDQPNPAPSTSVTSSESTPTTTAQPTSTTDGGNAAIASANAVDLTPDGSGLSKAVVAMKTSKGTLKIKLYAKDAPNSTKRFVELVQSKFYNGLSFHRVVPGFVVQAGDPKSKNKSDPGIGNGGSGTKLKAEFNGRKHVRGTVGLARTSSDQDSADSQFYICLGNFPHLDNTYTVIGQVVDFGEKVSDKDVLDRLRKDDDLIDVHVE